MGQSHRNRRVEVVIALVGRGDQSPRRILQVDMPRETELRVHHQCAGVTARGARGQRGQFEHSIRARNRRAEDLVRVQFADAQGFENPKRRDRQNPSDRLRFELVVASKEQLGSHPIAHAHPKPLLVAANLEVVPHHAGNPTRDFESPRSLPNQTRVEIANLIWIDGHKVRLQGLDVLGSVDHLSHLLDRRWGGEYRLRLEFGQGAFGDARCSGGHA